MIERIISGGQTGADRGGLDAAIELGLAHGGYCPRGRRAEDGCIPERYALEEMDSRAYAARTEANVRAADATLLVTRGKPTGGSALTAGLTRKHGLPLCHIDLDRDPDPAATLRAFLRAQCVQTLNVAGPRESHCPGIARDTRALLVATLTPQASGPPLSGP
jgi:hypothetical protein